MQFYENLNEMISYIENNLEQELDYKKLALIVGVNEYTLKRLFSIICDISINEYVRKRRLTIAGKDLVQDKIKIMDVAVKYGYDSATAFSRAFYKFHGIMPKDVKNNSQKLKYYPKLEFKVPVKEKELEYEVVSLDEIKLYGMGVKTTQEKIREVAPKFFREIINKYPQFGEPNYGMVVYQDRFDDNNYEYWVLWNRNVGLGEEVIIPASRWLKFKINSQDAKEIQEVSYDFYYKFLPTCTYKLRGLPELEYYHDGVTDFLVPID